MRHLTRVIYPKKFAVILPILITLVLSATVQIITLPQASAMDCSEAGREQRAQFYGQNDIPTFFDPCEQSTCATGGGSLDGPPPTELRGETNAEKVWNYLTDRGLSPIATAGAMGNIEAESGFSPFVVNPNGGAFGLIQWMGGRKTTIQQKLTEGGVPTSAYNDANNDKALLIELNWMWEEASTQVPTENYNFWEVLNSQTTVDGDVSIMGDGWVYVNGSRDHVDLVENEKRNQTNGSTLYFHAVIERSSMEGMDNRMSSAKAFIESYGNGGGSGSSECGTISEGGLTEEQAKKFMEHYINDDNAASVQGMAWFFNPGPSDCPGKPNCTAFSTYFIGKFTDLEANASGNGNQKVNELLAINPGAESGNVPRPFSVFQTTPNHTGVILGVHGDQVIIGEANCTQGMAGIQTRVVSLSEVSSGYQYIYTDGKTKQDLITEAMNG